jgi:hypothetical protein
MILRSGRRVRRGDSSILVGCGPRRRLATPEGPSRSVPVRPLCILTFTCIHCAKRGPMEFSEIVKARRSVRQHTDAKT